ncbi:hypothetical protein GPECTOR_16g534 [Gonium pectorale]|uniref:Peptidase S26 domain-containing protein n=1 Tax=Gonium pectorale TaxID=33097 RepID=A0A150GKN6_GONPE|nr:hypothetical protein GPECTOR_16g534 [Gonium pectorale]|eukprot:KXZ50361.1 hypothetical protein GPECTOR_16g534 [Gonium pectorale]
MSRAPGGVLALRYRLAKLEDAVQEFLYTAFRADKMGPPGSAWGLGSGAGSRTGAGWLPPRPGSSSSSSRGPSSSASGGDGDSGSATSGSSSGGGHGGGLLGSLGLAYRTAVQVYEEPLTAHMYLTGPAMAPTINRRGAKDPAARCRLVVRLLRRPGPGNVRVGDVVALHSPLAQMNDETHVMVRRVAALGGDEMVSNREDQPPFVIPEGHCWVLADNGSLRPEDGEVIDSRSYGPIPLSSVIGRVVFTACGPGPEDAGRVRNSPEASEAGGWGEDEAVVAAEVDVAALAAEEGWDGAEEEEEGESEGEEKGEEGKAKEGKRRDDGEEGEGRGKGEGKGGRGGG